ncbi:hypothetical protein, partial [Priestia megaterium]|uniref:hypothetical protein n=1 Tax=Priestia megaterium TaxID=1404 RepID=UPI001C98FC7A
PNSTIPYLSHITTPIFFYDEILFLPTNISYTKAHHIQKYTTPPNRSSLFTSILLTKRTKRPNVPAPTFTPPKNEPKSFISTQTIPTPSTNIPTF